MLSRRVAKSCRCRPPPSELSFVSRSSFGVVGGVLRLLLLPRLRRRWAAADEEKGGSWRAWQIEQKGGRLAGSLWRRDGRLGVWVLAWRVERAERGFKVADKVLLCRSCSTAWSQVVERAVGSFD